LVGDWTHHCQKRRAVERAATRTLKCRYHRVLIRDAQVILRDLAQAVTQFAQAFMAQNGVRHGDFYPLPIEAAASGSRHRHIHARLDT